MNNISDPIHLHTFLNYEYISLRNPADEDYRITHSIKTGIDFFHLLFFFF